jgi:predicted DNA-binding transcriptional regulator AlpA
MARFAGIPCETRRRLALRCHGAGRLRDAAPLGCVNILDAMAAKRKLNLAGLAEVAEVLQVTRRHAVRLTSEPDFPEPIARLRATPVWRRGDVERWQKRRKPNGRKKR